jgi:hypothetical protein
MRRNWLRNEARRKKKALNSGGRIPYIKQRFERYVEVQAQQDLDARGQAAVDDAVDLELDADDGDEYAPGDEIGFDKEDPEERAAYEAGGGSPSGSDDDDDDDDDDDEDGDEGDLDNLALRIEKADEAITLLHTKHHALLDGPKKNKDLGAMYEVVVDATNLCQSKPTENNVVAMELAYTHLVTAVDAHLASKAPASSRKVAPGTPQTAGSAPSTEKFPTVVSGTDKGVIVKTAEGKKSAETFVKGTAPVGIYVEIGADDRIVLEGFNPGVPVEVTVKLIDSLVSVINAFIGNAHHIPTLETSKASQFLGLARAKLSQMVDTTVAVKGRINADKVDTWLKVQQSLVAYLNKSMNMRAVSREPVAVMPPPPAAAVVVIEDEADAAADEQAAMDVQDDDADDAAIDEQARLMDIEDDAVQEEAEAADELALQAAAEAEEVEAAGSENNGEEQAEAQDNAADAAAVPSYDDDDNEPDAGAVGSAEEATKDKAPVQNVHAAPMAVPSRTDSLDVIETPPSVPLTTAAAAASTTSATNGKAAEPTLAVVALKLPGRPIFLLGTNDEQLKSEALKRSSVMPSHMSLDEFFKANYVIRRLPVDWKRILEHELKLRPVASSLYGKHEAQIWKQKQ